MSETKELTYQEISSHNSKKDLYLIIHGKVYDSTSFVDEHPGGEEVLVDVGGQDATEAFEDVGHSDEAREILDGMLVGNLKLESGDPEPKTVPPPPSTSASTKAPSTAGGMGVGLYALVLVGGALAFVTYQYLLAGSK